MDPISSLSNPKIKQARALRQRKARQEAGLFLVEGIWHVGEAAEAALSGNLTLQSILYAPALLKSNFANELLSRLERDGIACYAVTPEVFASLADKENPQGILAIASPRKWSLTDLSAGNFTRGVALVSPQDPGNVGTILRTIDSVGASGLLLLESSVDLYHPSAVRASMGALFWLPVVNASFESFVQWAHAGGYHIFGTSAHGDQDYIEVTYEEPHILLLGSERAGLTHEQAAVCHHLLRMPMLGRVTSLNLAVAAGVLLYEVLAKRRVR
jgi:TrmH family RNA methyltransferase